jgi:hypothetical protein
MSIVCSQCGAANPIQTGPCWLCRHPLSAEAPPTPGTSQPFAVPHVSPAQTFTISSLMLIIALIAVCLGVTREAPGLGIGLAVLCTPALIRAKAATARSRAQGQHVTIADKILAFAGSLGVVVLIGAAASAAFFATCFAGFFGGAATSSLWASGYEPLGWGWGAGIILGIVAGLWVFVWMLRRFWPTRKE